MQRVGSSGNQGEFAHQTVPVRGEQGLDVMAADAQSAAEQPQNTAALFLPWDVRLMNISTTLLYLLLGVGVGLVLLWTAVHAAMFKIEGTDIKDEEQLQHVSSTDIQKAMQPYLQQSLFLADISEAQHALEQIPWVYKAVVHRVFPNRLSIAVQEQQEAAHWGRDAEAIQWLNAQGEIFSAPHDDLVQQDLPILHGPDEQAKEVLQVYRELASLFTPLRQRLVHLELDVGESWRAILSGGTVLELGQGKEADLRQRALLYVDTVKTVIGVYHRTPVDVQRVDLRYRTGYALQVKGIRVRDGTDSLMVKGR